MHVLVNGLQAGNRSGTGRYTAELVGALMQLGDHIRLSVVWPAGFAPPQAGAGLQILEHTAHPARRLVFDQFGIEGLRRRLGADLVHYPANVGAVARKLPFVLTVHDLSYLRHPEWFPPGRALYYRRAVQRSARLARRIIADSQATATDLEELTGISPDRIDVVPLGVSSEFHPQDAAAMHGVRKAYNLPERFFLFTGTLEPRKNLPRLIRAWCNIAGDTDLDLVIAGREGWKVDTVREAILGHPESKRIHFPGFIPQQDLPALLSAAHAFVWPSLFEGFGLPPLEAMACGVPVLTANTSSLPEVVGAAALTVDPHDTDAIAGALFQLARDKELCAALREHGIERAAIFTWERSARMTLGTYRKALA